MTEQRSGGRTMSTRATPVNESTGDQLVDSAVARLAQLDELEVDEHGQIYDEIHASLNDVLNESQPSLALSPLPSPPLTH
ncbi:MAG: hypothetical protein H0V02_05235 [Nocardioidaceae bacterium]|nr:hypothetical protein [Nocardioidaceae bacterium]